MDVHPHAGAEQRQHAKEQMDDVRAGLHHMGTVDEENVAGAKPGEDVDLDVLSEPPIQADAGQTASEKRAGEGLDAGDFGVAVLLRGVGGKKGGKSASDFHDARGRR